MKISKSYKLSEFIDWTRRKLYVVLLLAFLPVALYQLLDQKWIALQRARVLDVPVARPGW